MRARLAFLAGVAAGYVLGSRAGRERYEQIMRTARKVRDNPTVQETAGLVQAQAGRIASTGRGVVGDKLAHTKIGQKLRGSDAEPFESHQTQQGF